MRKNAAFPRWLAFLLTLLILSAPVGCAAGERVSPGAVSIAAPDSLPEDESIRAGTAEAIGSGADAGAGLGNEPDDEWIIFDPDTIESVAIDMKLLRGSSWEGYAMVDPQSGETIILPYEEPDGTFLSVSVTLDEDGTGWFAYGSESGGITWGCDDTSIAWITLEDGRNYYMIASTMSGEGHSHLWLLLELEERLVWLY